MARLTKKLCGEIWLSTENCWHKAVQDYYTKYPDRNPLSRYIRHLKDKIPVDYRNIPEECKEEIDQMYRENLSKLTTQQLELVIEAYKKKKHRRSPVTMNYITGVLLERHMDTIKK
jgi:hypothetical protein